MVRLTVNLAPSTAAALKAMAETDGSLTEAIRLCIRDRHNGAAVQALRDAAHDWQVGGWADAPRRADRVQERLANAQFVTDWLRDRADRLAGGAE